MGASASTVADTAPTYRYDTYPNTDCKAVSSLNVIRDYSDVPTAEGCKTKCEYTYTAPQSEFSGRKCTYFLQSGTTKCSIRDGNIDRKVENASDKTCMERIDLTPKPTDNQSTATNSSIWSYLGY